MRTYIIEARSVATGNDWRPEDGGDRYDNEVEGLVAVRWLRQHEPANDDGSPIEYRVVRAPESA